MEHKPMIINLGNMQTDVFGCYVVFAVQAWITNTIGKIHYIYIHSAETFIQSI